MFDFDHNEIRQVDWLSGCCLMVSKSTFENSHGFDVNYFLFNEDVDLYKIFFEQLSYFLTDNVYLISCVLTSDVNCVSEVDVLFNITDQNCPSYIGK